MEILGPFPGPAAPAPLGTGPSDLCPSTSWAVCCILNFENRVKCDTVFLMISPRVSYFQSFQNGRLADTHPVFFCICRGQRRNWKHKDSTECHTSLPRTRSLLSVGAGVLSDCLVDTVAGQQQKGLQKTRRTCDVSGRLQQVLNERQLLCEIGQISSSFVSLLH